MAPQPTFKTGNGSRALVSELERLLKDVPAPQVKQPLRTAVDIIISFNVSTLQIAQESI